MISSAGQPSASEGRLCFTQPWVWESKVARIDFIALVSLMSSIQLTLLSERILTAYMDFVTKIALVNLEGRGVVITEMFSYYYLLRSETAQPYR
jgi:hypothetical protein